MTKGPEEAGEGASNSAWSLREHSTEEVVLKEEEKVRREMSPERRNI